MVCLECGIETKNPKFCSLSCSCKYNAKINSDAAKKRRIKLCPNCGKEFGYKDRRQQYCSHSCSAIANNERRGLTERIKIVCIVCGVEFSSKTDTRACCSSECLKTYNFNVRVEKFNRGEYVAPRKIRDILLTFKESKCDICGISDWQSKPISLQVHHKNGKCNDNQIENLMLLCPNCHTQTETYGAKNYGNSDRIVRYKRLDASLA